MQSTNTPSEQAKKYLPFKNKSAYLEYIETQVRAALAEDIGAGDVTAALVPSDEVATATILAREPAIICGIDWVQTSFQQVDKTIQIKWHVNEGEQVKADQTLCTLTGLARSLLTAERCALNFLQTLSGTATETNRYASLIADTKAKVLDTRKTIPLYRLAQKYAVNVGGGANQRIALYDGILIKENHIAAAGSIEAVLEQAFALQAAHVDDISIQIEVESLTQMQTALAANAPSILLDNFDVDMLKTAVAINQKQANPALLEASGGITLDTIGAIAQTGVDRISTGSLTKHVTAIDLSMRFSNTLDT